MTIGSSISSRLFVTNRTFSKETVLSSMSQLVHSKTAKSCLNEPSGVVNRFIQFTEMFTFNRTIHPRIGHRSSAHAQSSSTIAVWLARLVARVWLYCQEIGWILICGQVESFFIYLNQLNLRVKFISCFSPEGLFSCSTAFVEKFAFIAALFVFICRFILTSYSVKVAFSLLFIPVRASLITRTLIHRNNFSVFSKMAATTFEMDGSVMEGVSIHFRVFLFNISH